MLTKLANTLVRRRRLVLVSALVWFLVAGAFGGAVAKHLSNGGFADPASQSTKATNLLRESFHAGDPNVVLLVTAKGGRTVDDPQVVAQAQALADRLSHEKNVAQVSSYWSLGRVPPLKSKDSHQALVLARLSGNDDEVSKQVKPLVSGYQLGNDVIDVKMGGQAQIFNQIGTTVQKDLARAELYTFVPTLILLVLVFGSAMASLLPLAVAGMAVVSTFLALRVVAALTHVSIFALNLTTALGLALAIDWGLFMVSRYREEMRRGLTPHEAVVRTVETSGRTVIFAAATVATSLAVLLVFPMYFLKSFAYAGIAVVLLAAAAAVVVLPAILAALGTKVNLGTLWHRTPKEVGEGGWHRVATAVMRRPVVIGGAVVAVLLVLGEPFLRIHFGSPDDRVLPASASSRQVQTAIRQNFSGNEASAIEVVVPRLTGGPQAINSYVTEISTLPGVGRVDALTGSFIAGHQVASSGPASARFQVPAGTGTWLSVVPAVEPESAEGEALVKSIRHLPAPFPALVGGQSAQLVDSKAAIFGKLPLAGTLIALVTVIALFVMTGSVLVPFKAIVLNLLSLTATFGAMVWIFQQGHLANLLHFTATGAIDTTTPILMFCIAFGVSMDFEVMMLSRIKEEHDRTGDTVGSVATGLELTGRIVTAAALLQAVVFAAFGTSHVAFIKLFGVGLAMAVLVDASLVRAALVPAFMRLAGNANWWAPAPLHRLYQRIGLSESEGPTVSVPTGTGRRAGHLEEVA